MTQMRTTTSARNFARHRACRRRTPGASRSAGGFTIIEALVASLILAVGVMAMISLWPFSFRMTTQSDNLGSAYTVGRHAMERVKLAGYDYAATGATTLYYDRLGGSESSILQAQHRMQAVTTITAGAGYPSYDATCTVTITVTLLSTGETLYSTGATLTKKGI